MVTGDLLIEENFDAPGRWDQLDTPETQMIVSNGVLHIETGARIYATSLNYERHTDVIIEAATRVTSEDDVNGVGIVCRGRRSPDQVDGYFFLIGTDGSGSIRRSAGREVTALAAWTRTGAVQPGGARNHILAVCAGDYLALYVNGEFVAEARDTLYSSGYAGLTAVTTRPGQRVSADFDALRVYNTFP